LDQGIFPRVDAWFELHGDWDWPELGMQQDNPHYLPWLRAQKFTVWAHRTDLIHNARPFPAKQLVEKYGPYWFTSTAAWMFAFALDQGATEVGLFGIDMTARSEYLSQRPAMQRWMEIAHGSGVKVYIPNESDLMQPPELYGYSCLTPMGRKLALRNAELRHRINKNEAQIKSLQTETMLLKGGLDTVDYMSTVWNGGINSIVDSFTEK